VASDLILNGEILKKFGKSGEVLTLIFTSNGVEVKPRKNPTRQKKFKPRRRIDCFFKG